MPGDNLNHDIILAQATKSLHTHKAQNDKNIDFFKKCMIIPSKKITELNGYIWFCDDD